MLVLLLVLLIISSLMLIFVTFLQNSKREGAGNDVLGSMNITRTVGIRRSINILEKTTLYLFFSVVVISLLINRVLRNENVGISPNIEKIKEDMKNKGVVVENKDDGTSSEKSGDHDNAESQNVGGEQVVDDKKG